MTKWRKTSDFEKTIYISPLKLKIRVFRGLASHKITYEKCLQSTKLFAGRLYSWNSRETIVIASVWNFKISRFPLTSFHGKLLVTSFSRKCLWISFWRTTQKCILNKNLKQESIKSLSKTYKILKNLFGFDRQAIEHTHHIWACTITQMK